MKKLPVLLSIPHGGEEVPRELLDRIVILQQDILEDIDVYTREIYDLGKRVFKIISSNIARTFVDLNRAQNDLPNKNPDGVIKSVTCYGKVIYRNGVEPDDFLIKELLEKYYSPYHQKIQTILNAHHSSIQLALDCHSMASVAPLIAPDKGKSRPTVCLGNRFGQSCSQKTIQDLANCFQHVFSLKDGEVSINHPFAGGFITRTYGGQSIPWVQVELNRSLYLKKSFLSGKECIRNMKQILRIRSKFHDVLQLFFGN